MLFDQENINYVKSVFGLEEVEIFSIDELDEASMKLHERKLETAVPGNPSIVFTQSKSMK